MVEMTLHASIKEWYASPGDKIEVEVDGYVIDIVRGDTFFGDLLLEMIFSSLSIRAIHFTCEIGWTSLT